MEYHTWNKKELVVKATDFLLIAGHLYNMGPYAIQHRYVPKHERQTILAEAHGGVADGHYARKATTHKVLRIGLWWPTLHKDGKEYYQVCDVCQRTRKSSRRDEIPLFPHVTLHASDKWAIDFVAPINPPRKKTGVRYIITTIDYLTRWAEAQAVKDCSVETTMKFIF